MRGLSVFVHDEDALHSVKRKLQSFQGVTLYESLFDDNALHESMKITLSLVLDNALYEKKLKLEVNRGFISSMRHCPKHSNVTSLLIY